MKPKTVVKLCVWLILLFSLLCVGTVGIVGCMTNDVFSSEEYIWENWSISTNTVMVTNG